MVVGVYMIRHKQTGKIYIGSSQDIESRFAYHQSNYGSQVIHRAIKKYGVDAFDWLILEECTVGELISKEQLHLDSNQPFGVRGYNIRRIADRNTGIVLTEETRRKMSDAHRGKPKSLTHRRALSEASKKRDNTHLLPYQGIPHTEETKRLLSSKALGRTWSHDEERVRLHSEQRKGKKHSRERVEKIRLANVGQIRSEDTRKKMAAWQQRTYVAISPSGDKYQLTSSDLTDWLPLRALNKTNFCKAAKSGKPYKGWSIRLI